MRAGMSPQKACEFVLERIIEINGGLDKVDFNVKMVAMNLDGEIGVASIDEEDQMAPYASVITSSGYRLVKGTSLKKK
jgi:hypothetical protein